MNKTLIIILIIIKLIILIKTKYFNKQIKVHIVSISLAILKIYKVQSSVVGYGVSCTTLDPYLTWLTHNTLSHFYNSNPLIDC